MVKSSKSSPVTSHQDSCSWAGGRALPRFHVPAKTLSSTLSSFPHLTKFQSLIWWALKELHIDQRASFQKLCFISGLILPPKTSNLPLRTQMLHHLSSFIFFIISYVFIWTHLLSFTQKKSLHRLPPFQSLQGAALRNVFQNAWSRDISSSSNACRLERIGRRMHPWLFSMLIGLTWADLSCQKGAEKEEM